MATCCVTSGILGLGRDTHKSNENDRGRVGHFKRGSTTRLSFNTDRNNLGVRHFLRFSRSGPIRSLSRQPGPQGQSPRVYWLWRHG